MDEVMRNRALNPHEHVSKESDSMFVPAMGPPTMIAEASHIFSVYFERRISSK